MDGKLNMNQQCALATQKANPGYWSGGHPDVISCIAEVECLFSLHENMHVKKSASDQKRSAISSVSSDGTSFISSIYFTLCLSFLGSSVCYEAFTMIFVCIRFLCYFGHQHRLVIYLIYTDKFCFFEKRFLHYISFFLIQIFFFLPLAFV